MPPAANLTPIHVGHARTLLIGSLVARHYGCPFHVRFDGQYRDPLQTPPLVVDRGDAILEVIGCLQALGVSPDRIYWCSQDSASLALARQGDISEVRAGWAMNDAHLGAILDDAIDHAPSLIVRGTEFTSRGILPFAGVAHLGQFVVCENAVFKILDEQKHEFTVPMIYLGAGKMSKSKLTVVPWQALTAAEPEVVRRFLLATAMNPDEPLSCLDKPFSIERLNLCPYRWDWKQWVEAIRRS